MGRPARPSVAPIPPVPYTQTIARYPLRSTPPPTDDTLTLKSLHTWGEAPPAHTEGHVAAGPDLPSWHLFPSSGMLPTPCPAPPRWVRTYVHHRTPVGLPSQTVTTPWPQSVTGAWKATHQTARRPVALPRAPPPRRRFCLGHMAVASDQDQLCPSRLGLERQGVELASGASPCTHQLSSQRRSGLDSRPQTGAGGRRRLEASSPAWRPRCPLDRGNCRGEIG